MLLVLFGGVAGQGVVWYTGMFYELFFLLQTLKLEAQTANLIVAFSLIIGTPFFIIFGALSDKVGRKWIIMAGCLIAALTYFPIFKALTHYANPGLEEASAANPVVVVADPGRLRLPVRPHRQEDLQVLLRPGEDAPRQEGHPVHQRGGPGRHPGLGQGRPDVVQSFNGNDADRGLQGQERELAKALGEATKMYPAKADMSRVNTPMVILLLVILVIYVTMVYAPIGAWLVELFPARIRYTSMSLPYHIGNGWFGGFLPTIAFALVAATGDIYYGLWYPIVHRPHDRVVGSLFMRDTDTQGAIHHT